VPFQLLSAATKITGNLFCGGASSPSAGPPIASPSTFVSTSSSSSSLSTGAKAGIGVGIAVGAFLLLSGVLPFYLRKRRQTRSAPLVVDPISDSVDVAASTLAKVPLLGELEGGHPRRKDTGGRSELETTELPG
jgi:hypothetical protein